MKKTLSLVLVMVLVAGFAIGVFAKPGDQHPPTHECWYETDCNDYGCIIYKCCIDCVWNKGGYDCTDPICVPLT